MEGNFFNKGIQSPLRCPDIKKATLIGHRS